MHMHMLMHAHAHAHVVPPARLVPRAPRLYGTVRRCGGRSLSTLSSTLSMAAALWMALGLLVAPAYRRRPLDRAMGLGVLQACRDA